MFIRFAGSLAVLGTFALSALAGPAAAAERAFTAVLEPNRSILPGDVKAGGTANFGLSSDGKTLTYKVDVFGIDAVSQIHIHFGPDASTADRGHYHLPPTENDHGRTVVFLLNFKPKGVKGNGTVAQGKVTADTFFGPARNQPMEYLVEHLTKGFSYVNIHIFQDFGGGRKYCCPSGLQGVIWPAE